MNDYKELFETAQVEQLKQMRANEEEKSGWDNLGLEDVGTGIYHNFFKLNHMPETEDRVREEIRRLANIMNFAAMGVLRLKKDQTGKERVNGRYQAEKTETRISNI